MLTYLVGGAVRDKLLGVPCRDRDFLVVGSTPQEMLQKGFIEVGKSFAIFLHPETREEYTLAPDLEKDLGRRDLTINALAMDADGKIIDLFGGLTDLQNKVLKHIQDDNFYEDPLRVYRVARLKCQYPEFSIDPMTLRLMEKTSQTISFKELSGERIFAELKGALATDRPSTFFQVLKEVNALNVHFPSIASFEVLDATCRLSQDLVVRFAALMRDVGNEVSVIGKRLLIPNDWLEAAMIVTRFHSQVHSIDAMEASSIVKMFYEMDAFRKPSLVHILALVSEVSNGPQGKFMEDCFKQIMSVSSKDIPEHFSGKQIGEAIHAERVKRLKIWLESH